MFQRLYVWQETPHWTSLWEDTTEKADLLFQHGSQRLARFGRAFLGFGKEAIVDSHGSSHASENAL